MPYSHTQPSRKRASERPLHPTAPASAAAAATTRSPAPCHSNSKEKMDKKTQKHQRNGRKREWKQKPRKKDRHLAHTGLPVMGTRDFHLSILPVEVPDNKVSGETNHSLSATTSPSAMNATITSVTPAMTTVTLTETMVSLEPKNISPTPEGKASTTEMTKVTEDTSPATSAGPTQTHTDVSDQLASVKTSPDLQLNTSHAPFSTTAQATTLEMVSTATTLEMVSTTVLTEQTSHSAIAGPLPSSSMEPYYTFACKNIKHVKNPRVICLHLSEPDTCNNFLKTKGANLSLVICDTTPSYNHFSSPPCHIELAKSEVDPSCMLLIQAGVKDADAIEKVLRDRKSDLNKIGIKSHKLESIGHHQNIPRNTLIALVTSGLLLAFLSLAGYFLMKRRSWSPRGERL
ncbi:hematopoietic progenitor cell antigen CD34 isoform X3 [Mauremys reevesii]|nr:hematopoietic progenitor cell antigen CD34 isoform X3 [Mauremys reevesii]